MTAHIHRPSIAAPADGPRSLPSPASALSRLLVRLRRWREVARQRRALARLSPAQLRDIGLDEEAALAEANRMFWDAPRHWRA